MQGQELCKTAEVVADDDGLVTSPCSTIPQQESARLHDSVTIDQGRESTDQDTETNDSIQFNQGSLLTAGLGCDGPSISERKGVQTCPHDVSPGMQAYECHELPTLRRDRLPHPLKAPIRRNTQGVPICRFHNYRVVTPRWVGPACKDGDACAFDHRHCHLCGLEGHIALNCTNPTTRPLL